MKKSNKKSDFTYYGTFKFDPTSSPIDPIQLEKKKYKEAILKYIKELEKETSEDNKGKANKKEFFDVLLRSKLNQRATTVKYENGEIYPKDIPFPDIRFIQFAEPHVLLTDLYDQDKEWYHMHPLIEDFAEESYLSYEMGFWLASIASAINCCEYILKYEYLRYLNKKDKAKAEKLSLSKTFSLGAFIWQDNTYLEELQIKQFYEKIDYLNSVRISIYHFSPEKAEKANKGGNLEIEKITSVSDDIARPITAFRVYSIMIDLIKYFYNKKMQLQYIKECVSDWINKRGLKEEDLNT